MPTAPQAAIANQVFIGCPWRNVRPKYEAAIPKLERRFPLHFVIVGRGESQDAEELFGVIQQKLLSSSYAIFDVTGGNPNVSLEFGFAEASDIRRAIYISTHAATRPRSKDAPIIADLAGKTRQQYAQQAGLLRHLIQFCEKHDYTQQFERRLTEKFGRKRKSGKRSKRKQREASQRRTRMHRLAIRVIRILDDKQSVRRQDVVATLKNEGFKPREISDLILWLHQKDLIVSQQGPYAKVQMPSA